jgi:hypothetical protein
MSLLSLLTSDGFQGWPLVLIVIGLHIILVRKGAHSS